MEKLQAALNKARQERRSEPTPGTVSQAAAQRSAPPVTKTAEAWQALKPFDVPETVLRKHRVVTRSANPDAAPFDILRTKILVQMRQNGWKRLAITSPMPKSGKTTMACNLALGLGRQTQLRSVLLDLDLRDPSIEQYFETTPEYSIGDVLSREVSFGEQAMRIGDNVAVSMSNRREPDPTKLLLSDKTAEALDRIEKDYQPDLMIFDLPSMLVNDDTRAFLKNADCALIVIRADATRYGEFDSCEREIAEQTNVLGVVLNAYMHPYESSDG